MSKIREGETCWIWSHILVMGSKTKKKTKHDRGEEKEKGGIGEKEESEENITFIESSCNRLGHKPL